MPIRKTVSEYKKAGFLTYNYVTAFHPAKNSSWAVRPGGQGIEADDSTPITLERMKSLYQFCCDAEQENLGKIKINMSAYLHNDGGEGPNPQLFNKVYEYNPETNSMIVWEDGMPIYANDNGVICDDQAALCDTIFE